MQRSIRLSKSVDDKLQALKNYKSSSANRLNGRNNSVTDSISLAIELVYQLFVEPFLDNTNNSYEKMLKKYLADSKLADDQVLKTLKIISKKQDKEYLASLNQLKLMIVDTNGSWIGQMDHYNDRQGITKIIDEKINRLIDSEIKLKQQENNLPF